MPTDWQDVINRYHSQQAFGNVLPPSACHPVSSATDVALSTTEAILSTLTPTQLKGNQKILLIGWCAAVSAAVSTDPVFRIRRGTLTSDPLVGEAVTVTLAPSTSGAWDVMVLDTPVTENQSYILTGTMTTGTGTARTNTLFMLPML